MLFNSLAFAVFLPIVFCLYWALPHKHRWAVLLVASYYFYMSWNVKYVVLILFTTVVSYLAAILMEKTEQKKRKSILLAATLIASLGVLFFFKYFSFFYDSVSVLFQKFAITLHPLTLKLMLPVGISFYTFQTLSYVIDVYRGEVEPEHHFGKYAAFISFFPQLVAGPIERTKNLLPQIMGERTFHYSSAVYGLKLMAWGFFKKLVIADNLSVYVDDIYGELHYHNGFSLLLATVFFAFQIYCDFSGYSDIAIGCAKLFDIDLMKNFQSPYFASGLKEFWSRWHISLSTWFRDYIYIPLGGNRKGKIRSKLNLLITFMASGLWHGSSWNFVIWGAFHGLGQIIEKMFQPLRRKEKAGKRTVFGVVVTFFVVVIGWVFFRAATVAEAKYVIVHMWSGLTSPLAYFKNGFLEMKMPALDSVSLFAALVLLGVYDFVGLKGDPLLRIEALPKGARWILYYGFVFFVLLFASFNSQEFVYFQF